MSLIKELRRRGVIRTTGLYAVAAWGASLGAAELLPAFGLPDESVRWFVVIAFALLPIVALCSWAFEWTPTGLELDPVDVAAAASLEEEEDPIPPVYASHGHQAWTLTKPFTIGRDESCELHIADSRISRRHARVLSENGVWFVEDLGSSNGTRLNGDPLVRQALPSRAELVLYEGGEPILLQIEGAEGVTTQLVGTNPKPSVS